MPPRTEPERRRTTLALRISLLTVGVAVLTALAAGAIATGLIRNAGASAAQQTLGRFADVAASVADTTAEHPLPNAKRRPTAEQRARKRLATSLAGLHVRLGFVQRDGTVHTKSPQLRAALTGTDTARLLADGTLTEQRNAGGSTVFIQGRRTENGAVVLLQRRADAVAPVRAAFDRLLLALLIAGVTAGLLGLFVAWRLALPLRRAARAAHSVAAGNRNVTLPAVGPAEVVEVSEAVNAVASALAFSEARQREFLLSVSHDLRTPLTAIAGYAESLAGDVVPAEDVTHVGGVLLGESKRLERLVGDLLDLARLGAQDFRVEIAAVDVAGVAQDAAIVWAARCAAAGVEFRLDVAGPAVAWTDAARLRQLLDGLFDNALRVTPAGAPIVLAVRAEDVVVAEVRDGGPGLTDDDLTVAFAQGALHERYRGVREVGTGLGLAIVHGLATRLGGQVRAGHAPEGGALFAVRLPAARP